MFMSFGVNERGAQKWFSERLDKIISSSEFLQELSTLINEKLADFSEKFLDLFGRKKSLKIKKVRRAEVLHHEEMNFSEHTRQKFSKEENVATVENISVAGEKISAKIIKLPDEPKKESSSVDWNDLTKIDDKKFLDGLRLGIGLAFLSIALNGFTDHLLFNIPSSMLMWLLGALSAAIKINDETEVKH